MSWRVLRMATIFLWGLLLLVRGNLEWLMLLLIPVISTLMLLMIAPCINNCLTHFVSAQVSKLQHAMSVQQGFTKLHLTTENITHPQMDIAIRTLRLETSKRGRPNAPCCPSSAGSSQRDCGTPLPKNWASHLEGGMLGSQNRKKESKMAVAKRQRKEKVHKSGTEGNPWTGVRTSGETNTPPSWLVQFAQGRLCGEEYKRKKPRRIEASLLGSARPHSSWVYHPLFFPIKLSCNQKKKKKSSFPLICQQNSSTISIALPLGDKKTDYLATWGWICTRRPTGGCPIQMGILSPFSKLLIFNEFSHLTPRGIVATLCQNSQNHEPYDKRFNCIHIVPFDRGF